MSYCFSIEPLISFCEENKSKVMTLEENKRVAYMYRLFEENDLNKELIDRCNDEIEDTLHEISDILEVKWELIIHNNNQAQESYVSSDGDIPF